MAVEKSPMAAETYFRNLISSDVPAWDRHPTGDVETQGLGGLVVGTLESVLNDHSTMARLAGAQIDLVAGGPPCQGFSLAGRRQSDDPRNRLAWQFLEFVAATNPRFVIIENVVGMHRKFRSASAQTPFDSLRIALSEQGDRGYAVQGVLLNAKHFGAPQSRPRMMLIGVRKDVAESLAVTTTQDVIASAFTDATSPAESLGPSQKPAQILPRARRASTNVRTVAEAIFDLDPALPRSTREAVSTDYVKELSDTELWRLERRVPAVQWHPANTAFRTHRESTQQLFRLLSVLKDHKLTDAARRARSDEFAPDSVAPVWDLLTKLDFPIASRDGALAAGSADELMLHIRRLLTRKHSQTVLDWDQPSRTVVTIPDDYIHPLLPRTFSVRELARLQGFPDAFEFYGKVTTGGHSRRFDVPQYTQVGNAVSPFVGLALGELIANYSALLDEVSPTSRPAA